MELERSDLELILSQLWIAGNEQEEIAGRVSEPDEYMETARYLWNLSARIKAFRDGSNAEKFSLVEKPEESEKECICEQYAGVKGSAEWVCPQHGRCSTGSFIGVLRETEE